MTDPWLPLIAALSGQCVATPSTWPLRKVHRLDCQPPPARRPQAPSITPFGRDGSPPPASARR